MVRESIGQKPGPTKGGPISPHRRADRSESPHKRYDVPWNPNRGALSRRPVRGQGGWKFN